MNQFMKSSPIIAKRLLLSADKPRTSKLVIKGRERSNPLEEEVSDSDAKTPYDNHNDSPVNQYKQQISMDLILKY